MNHIARKLRERKIELGISEARLAERAGLSRTAVRQALSDPARSVGANLCAIADQLGLDIMTTEKCTTYEVRRRAAKEKARALIAIVQDNSELELQAVGEKRKQEMIEQTTDEIMAGPLRNLWIQ